MIVVGLTGSIGMGKSAAGAALRRHGIPVHDADAAVHRAMAPGGAAVPAVERAFPGVVADGAVDRGELGRRVYADEGALRRLEAILHPLVRQSERRFLARQRARRVPVAVLDVPLLFETGAWRRCAATVVVSAPGFVQRLRVLRRRGMTMERLAVIEAQQLGDAGKRRRADAVIATGLDRRASRRALLAFVARLRGVRRSRPW